MTSHKTRLFLLGLLIILATLFANGGILAREVRVGVYANEPKIFLNDQGEASGIFPDLLREIGAREKWTLKFVPCVWQQCLEMVEKGELDLMPDVAQTPARAELYDFHQTPALNSWSVIYRHPNVAIQSLLDLKNKSVAVLKDSVQQTYLQDAFKGFGFTAKLIPVDSFEEGFAKVQAGQIDAVAVNQHFGTYALDKFHLVETPIIFQPSHLFFVTKKETNADLLTTIDYYLNQWRDDSNSPFFHVIKKWAGQTTVTVIPTYLWWALGGVSLMGLLLFGIASYLRIEVKRRTAEIVDHQKKLSSILDAVGAAIYIKDKSLRYQYVNRAASEILGQKPEDIVGKLDRDLQDEKSSALITQTDRNVIESGRRYAGEDVVRLIGSDTAHTFFSVKIPLINSSGDVYGLCGISTDITDQLEFTKKIDLLAHFDPLTGLFNRAFFFEEAQRLLNSPDRPIAKAALILINLDNFKDLNDTQGHLVGDLLLKELADQFSLIKQNQHVLARLVGDSFVFLIHTLPPERSAIEREVNDLVQQIKSAVTRPKKLEDVTYHGTASIGISIFEPHTVSVHEGLKQAELAMYQAKSLDRGQTRTFEAQMGEIAAARLTLESELGEAIENGQLEVFYQPQVDKGGTLISMEALIRWHHPKHGLYAPAAFIPLAESTGQILSIGHFVLESACEQLHRWSTQPDMAKLVIAVNVSAREFFDEGFIDRVIRTLSKFSFNPGCLELELTESQLLQDFEGTMVKLNALKGIGLRLSLDDFGTGYSSLSRLKNLPFDQLKIDAAFVRDLVTNPSDSAIIKTIIDLGKTLHVEILAEGVETQAQMDILIALGCEKFQGYLHGKPMPMQELMAGHAQRP